MLTALAAEVIVGAEPPGHLTVAGQVAVRPPVASCTSLSSRLATPPVGAVKVKVQLPVIVTFSLLPLFQSTVLAVPELPRYRAFIHAGFDGATGRVLCSGYSR